MIAQDLKSILLNALDDERKAEATYQAVIDKFGPVRPFINIVQAERRHANALIRQLERLGMEIPANQWAGKVIAPASLAEACKVAVQGEVENIELFDQLIPQVTDRAARNVLENLQAASRDNHLPAFRRCLARECGGS